MLRLGNILACAGFLLTLAAAQPLRAEEAAAATGMTTTPPPGAAPSLRPTAHFLPLKARGTTVRAVAPARMIRAGSRAFVRPRISSTTVAGGAKLISVGHRAIPTVSSAPADPAIPAAQTASMGNGVPSLDTFLSTVGPR